MVFNGFLTHTISCFIFIFNSQIKTFLKFTQFIFFIYNGK